MTPGSSPPSSGASMSSPASATARSGEALFGPTDDRLTARRQAARVARLLGRLRAHGYVAKIPHTRRWRVTLLGRAAMSAVLDVRDNAFPASFTKAAA